MFTCRQPWATRPSTGKRQKWQQQVHLRVENQRKRKVLQGTFYSNLLKGLYIHFSAIELYRCLLHEEVQVRLLWCHKKHTKLKKTETYAWFMSCYLEQDSSLNRWIPVISILRIIKNWLEFILGLSWGKGCLGTIRFKQLVG